MAVGTFLLRTQIIFAREPLVSIRRRADIIEAMSFMKTILNLLRSKLLNCLPGFQPSGLMIYRFFPPYSARTISGTALQERARAISSKDETMHGLIIKLSVENSLEGRDEIYVVAQKTVTTV